MEVTEKYANLVQRQEKITLREGQGFRMLHDDFDDPSWKHGDPIIGTMTFTDEPEVIMTTEPVRDLAAEIDDLKAKIKTLETR